MARLFIADEVQGGFGRMGSWWGFEREAGLVPDIVTLGKPMGAGHPIGGMIIKSDLVAAFGQKRRYFNTFGGTTVSAAVGTAALDVIEGEGLLETAAHVGAHFRERLDQLASRHEQMGDVRGSGLYLGVELVTDRESKTPWTEGAASLVNALRRKGVLVGTCGKAGNVLKIRPPLAFKAEHVGRFAEALDEALKGA